MGHAAESARHAAPKIEFSCSCGKRYRVAASKAGEEVRCKRCRLKVKVPGDPPGISLRTRKAILEELGIDAEAAERAYEVEQTQGYHCALCAAKIEESELPGAYGEAGLVCGTCRAAEVAERGEDDGTGKKKKAKQLDQWTTQGTVEGAKRKAWGMSALFLVGTAGFCANVLGLGWPIAATIGAVVAAGGWQAIFRAYEPVPEKPKGIRMK